LYDGSARSADLTCKLTHKEIVKAMRALRKRIKLDKMTIREMIAAGRRF
jgi:hypothetical protein